MCTAGRLFFVPTHLQMKRSCASKHVSRDGMSLCRRPVQGQSMVLIWKEDAFIVLTHTAISRVISAYHFILKNNEKQSQVEKTPLKSQKRTFFEGLKVMFPNNFYSKQTLKFPSQLSEVVIRCKGVSRNLIFSMSFNYL